MRMDSLNLLLTTYYYLILTIYYLLLTTYYLLLTTYYSGQLAQNKNENFMGFKKRNFKSRASRKGGGGGRQKGGEAKGSRIRARGEGGAPAG